MTPLSVAIAIVAGAVSVAGADGPSAARLAQLIDQLDAPSLAVREASTRTLIESETSFDEIRRAGVEVNTLSAEQRSRLDRVLYERFKRSPRAGLGVAFDPQFAGGVRLASIVANFPSAAFLQPLDVIVRAEDAGFAPFMNQQAWQAFRRRILSFDPGQTLPLVVRRGERAIQMDVPLGSYDDLGRAAPLTDEDYAAAWEFRRSRLGFELRDPGRIEAPSRASLWPLMTPLDRRRMGPEPSLIAGGSPGSRPVLRLEELDKLSRHSKALLQAQNAGLGQAKRPQAVVAVRNLNTQPQRTLILRQIDQWEQIRANARVRAEDPALGPRERSHWAQQVVRAEEQLAMLRQRLDGMSNNR